MSNSPPRFTAQEHETVQDGLFSSDVTRRAIEQEFIVRLLTHLCVATEDPLPVRMRKIVAALDAGQLDRLFEQFAPETLSAAPQRFDDVTEFDYAAWRQRRER
jgi:hypothetical protein